MGRDSDIASRPIKISHIKNSSRSNFLEFLESLQETLELSRNCLDSFEPPTTSCAHSLQSTLAYASLWYQNKVVLLSGHPVCTSQDREHPQAKHLVESSRFVNDDRFHQLPLANFKFRWGLQRRNAGV
eukprot:1193913-Prorocentrum_minimum.AAC.2